MNDADIDALAIKIEEAARSTEEGVRYFIEPASGTLNRAIAKRHHIVFGRRGSGKSSLLRKAGADLTIDRRPIALVNLEAFKSHSYPDVLLSVLISTFTEYARWMKTAAIHPANKISFWTQLFGTKPSRGAFNREQCQEISERIDRQIVALEQQLHSSDNADLVLTRDVKNESGTTLGLEGKVSSPYANISATTKSSQRATSAENIQEAFSRVDDWRGGFSLPVG